uniref:Uncharacterized protein LOC100376229 n=1 Tax=Saccoglossus kowalevskii TaxID=10224 RepID=A0ABM0GWC7_SACKO
MANEIHFGDRECRLNAESHLQNDICRQSPQLCNVEDKTSKCGWYYTGTGYEYQLLAGPLFNIIFSFTSVPVGLILEKNKSNRKNVIAISAVLWSFMVILGGLATQYWHIAVTRLAIAFFEGAFTAFAVSLIGSHFSSDMRSMAMGIFMWGVYFGYSSAFMLKFAANIYSWRIVYFMTGIPGIIFAVITYCTVSDPVVEHLDYESSSSSQKLKEEKKTSSLSPAPLFNHLYIVLVLAGSIRCAGGHTFNYNIHNYVNYFYPGYPIERFLSWIPAVTGVAGTLVGGIWADRLSIQMKQGFMGRLTVILFTLVLSTPLSMLILFSDPPWFFLFMIPCYLLNECLGGILMTAILEQAPVRQQVVSVAIYSFSLNILGGNITLLVPMLRAAWGWQ